MRHIIGTQFIRRTHIITGLVSFVALVFVLMIRLMSVSIADGNKIHCTITTPTSAEVGETVTVTYALSGGSGRYTNTYISVFGRAAIYGGSNPIGRWDERQLTESTGSLEFVAPAGEQFGIMISGRDEVTGEEFWFHKDFDLTPNSNYPITLSADSLEHTKGDTIIVEYSISGLDGQPQEAKIWWGIGKYSSSPEMEANSTDITVLSGTASFSPAYGDCVVCYLSGKDKDGTPFFAKTDYIVLKDNEGYQKIACSIITPDSAEVGEKVTVSYEITGGSGQYKNTYISVFGRAKIYGGSNPIGRWDERQLTAASGSLEFIAPAGEEFGIMISGRDRVTNEDFWFHKDFRLIANSNYPITLSADSYVHYKGESISVDYSIAGLTNPQEAKIWWGIGKYSSSPEMEINSTNVSVPSGQISYCPTYGDCVVCYFSGKDNNGIPFFARTEYIILKDITEAEIQKLPSSLTRIESEAFAGTKFIAVEIPESVTYIAEDAFTNSSVRVIYGSTQYVKEYADNHSILYKTQ